MLWNFALVLGLMLASGLFAGAEIAVLSVRKTRLGELVEQGAGGARAVQWLRHQPERFLATVQIAITVIGTAAAAIAGDRIAGDFGRWLAPRAPWIGAHANQVGLAVAVVLISALEIVLAELVPKSLALRSAERYSLLLGPGLRFMATVTRPLVWALTLASNAVLRLFGDRTSFTEARLSPDEIQELVEEAGRVGSLDAKTTEVTSRALEFRTLMARDVMVTRGRIVALPKTATPEELRDLLAQRRFARFPVWEGTAENIVGYVTLKDLVLESLSGVLSMPKVLRPVTYVPGSMMAADLLRQLQSKRAPLAMVVGERGDVLGLITIEDLIEELVGEIMEEEEPDAPRVARAADGAVLAPGAMTIREFNRAMGFELPEPEGFTTLAGLCLHAAGRIPTTGAIYTLEDGHRIEVVEASARRVRTVRVFAAVPEKNAEDGGDDRGGPG